MDLFDTYPFMFDSHCYPKVFIGFIKHSCISRRRSWRRRSAANSEAWLDGHVHAFAFFGAVPQSVLYDNDRCLVARILPDGSRQRTQRFSAMLSHYVIRDRYGRPGKGNDKGAVEGLVGYGRRNFMVPIPRFASWEAFNIHLEEQCRKRQSDVLRGHRESIGERFKVMCRRASQALTSFVLCVA